MKKLYIPSSTRNQFYPAVVARARAAGYSVHDWSEPPFRWGAVDPDYQNWSIAQYVHALRHPATREHFESYVQEILECDACALLLPAGTDAHAEALLARTFGKPTIVCFADGHVQRELIHCRFELFVASVDELFSVLERILRGVDVTAA
jgi:prepilin-type processing-associated H-X9-DG protein